MDNKKWKTVDYGTLNTYRISIDGDIQVKAPGDNSQWKNKSVKEANNGYYYFRIGKKPKSLHREVLKCFEGNPVGNKNTVDHLNGNKSDNMFSNLEWVTQAENNRRFEASKQKASKN